MLIIKQTIEESASEARTDIQLETLNVVKDILASPAFSSDEKIHLIESRFIVEKAEIAELDEEMENIGTLFGEGAACCSSCEAEAPIDQMSIFEFLGANSIPEEKTEETVTNEVPEEVIAFMQELASVLHAAFGK